MKMKIAKKNPCEEDLPGNWQSQKQKMQWRSYVMSKLDDQENIRDKEVDAPGAE